MPTLISISCKLICIGQLDDFVQFWLTSSQVSGFRIILLVFLIQPADYKTEPADYKLKTLIGLRFFDFLPNNEGPKIRQKVIRYVYGLEKCMGIFQIQSFLL